MQTRDVTSNTATKAYVSMGTMTTMKLQRLNSVSYMELFGLLFGDIAYAIWLRLTNVGRFRIYRVESYKNTKYMRMV